MYLKKYIIKILYWYCILQNLTWTCGTLKVFVDIFFTNYKPQFSYLSISCDSIFFEEKKKNIKEKKDKRIEEKCILL